jgi:RNA polymerase sigma-70 factor (ECF subfamily)
MQTVPDDASDPRGALLALYDTALPQVYGYLRSRCGSPEIAEDLTAETFLAAVDAARGGRTVDIAWLIGVARHKLADHWRRRSRDERNLRAAAMDRTSAPREIEPFDAIQAADTLSRLAAQHRLALTLRYVDDLPVSAVAELLGRTLHATEALLMRAKRAFRAAYATTDEQEQDRG